MSDFDQAGNDLVLDVALCGDRRVLPGLALTVRSALESSTCPINVHLITEGLREEDKARLLTSWKHANCRSVKFAEISRERISGFRSTAYLKSKMAYSRYFIPDKFPDLERCVYLDADLMVFRDLRDALQLDLAGNIAAAVRDISTRVTPTDAALRARLGLRDERNYFNSGFMVMDCSAWRREGITDKLVRVSLERFDNLSSQDQDALNLVLEDNVLLLDETWNTSQYEKPQSLNGRIIHLIGTVKPWHSRYKEKFQEAYFRDVIFKSVSDLLERTEFKDSLTPSIFGEISERFYQKMPTMDMIRGKIRRLAS